MTWVGFPVAIAVALLVVPAGVRGLRDAGLVRENYRGAALAFPLGAVLATAALVALAPLAFLDDRGDLDLLDPELRRWLPYLLGVAFLGFLDDSLGRGEAAARRAAGAGTRGRCAKGGLSTGAIKAIGALALAAYVVSGRGLESWRYLADVALLILATNAFNLLDLRPGRAEKGAGAARRRPLPRRLDASRRSSCSGSSPGRSWSAPGSPCASGRCWATPAPTWSGRSPGSGC